MRTDLLERYGGAVPRYTSYPTAPHFHGGVNGEVYGDWLEALAPETTTSLYLHVPFCDQLCWYCGCNTRVVNRYGPIEHYAQHLITEIDLVAERLQDRPSVCHLHLGGGTPTILRATELDRAMDRLHAHFRFEDEAELAIEADPRTLTQETARRLADLGFNRVSLGVQDFTDEVQRAINRVQSFETVSRAVDLLREAGLTAINFDLMYGLPRQSVEDAVSTVDQAVRLSPDRFSVFGYAHVPWMKSHQKLIPGSDLPDAPTRMRQADATAERLVEHGYRRIGLDHFARPEDSLSQAHADGELHRNFQGYTTDPADALIAFGASAIGCLPAGYVQNTSSARDYMAAIEAGKLATQIGIATSNEDRMRRRVIEQLMCAGRVDLDRVTEEHGQPSDSFTIEFESLRGMQADGLVELNGTTVRVTDLGAPFVRTVSAVFDTYLASGRGKHSAAV